MNKYDWIKPGVHAWVAGLVCPVEVEVKNVVYSLDLVWFQCGIMQDGVNFRHLYQTEAECLEAMKKEFN